MSVVHLGTPQTLVGFYREERWHGKNVHEVVFRDIRHSRGLKSVILAAYTLVALVALAVACGLAALGGGPGPLGAAAAFLLTGPLLLAVSAGMARRRPGLVFPLAVMYLTYGIARALCLVGLSGQRLRQ